jgi:hypothetical protein
MITLRLSLQLCPINWLETTPHKAEVTSSNLSFSLLPMETENYL